jgi:hypothetical protein
VDAIHRQTIRAFLNPQKCIIEVTARTHNPMFLISGVLEWRL